MFLPGNTNYMKYELCSTVGIYWMDMGVADKRVGEIGALAYRSVGR